VRGNFRSQGVEVGGREHVEVAALGRRMRAFGEWRRPGWGRGHGALQQVGSEAEAFDAFGLGKFRHQAKTGFQKGMTGLRPEDGVVGSGGIKRLEGAEYPPASR